MSAPMVVAPASRNAVTMSTRCPAHVKRTAVTTCEGTGRRRAQSVWCDVLRSRASTALSLAALAYAGVLSAATLHRHSSLESGGYDLGIFEQGVWLLGHG